MFFRVYVFKCGLARVYTIFTMLSIFLTISVLSSPYVFSGVCVFAGGRCSFCSFLFTWWFARVRSFYVFFVLFNLRAAWSWLRATCVRVGSGWVGVRVLACFYCAIFGESGVVGKEFVYRRSGEWVQGGLLGIHLDLSIAAKHLLQRTAGGDSAR